MMWLIYRVGLWVYVSKEEDRYEPLTAWLLLLILKMRKRSYLSVSLRDWGRPRRAPVVRERRKPFLWLIWLPCFPPATPASTELRCVVNCFEFKSPSRLQSCHGLNWCAVNILHNTMLSILLQLSTIYPNTLDITW